MPRKYHGEPERDPKKVAVGKVAEAAIGAGLAGALGGVARGVGRRLGEVRKFGQKHKPKKRTFKYDPSQEGQN